MRVPRLGRGSGPLRIAYGRIFHEACAWSPLRTTQADFERFHHLEGQALARAASLSGSELKGYMSHAELTGFQQAATLAGGVQTLPLASSLCVPSGPLTAACFEWLVGNLVARLQAAGVVDGLYLALHGSMQVEGLLEAPEAVILRRVRAVLPPEARLAVSYDLHANLSPGLLEPADVLIGYRTNPHWDLAPTGFRAGNRLIRVLRGQLRPVHAWRKLPLVLGGGTTIDFAKPMRQVFRWMKRLERRDSRVISASLFMVHPYTSAEDLGWAAHICTDNQPALAQRLAEELADRAWAQRKVPLPRFLEPAEALRQVATPGLARRLGPASLVDVDDIVGAGAPGGSTHLLRSILKDSRGLTIYLPIHDPLAVEHLWKLPLGIATDLTLTGTPGYGMPPAHLTDVVLCRKEETDFGRTVRLDLGTVHVAVCERSPLPIHPKFWRGLGLPVRDADAVVQKNFFHYRIFYGALSFRHLPVVTDGATSLRRVRSRTYAVPVYPGADPHDWRPADPILRAGIARQREDVPEA